MDGKTPQQRFVGLLKETFEVGEIQAVEVWTKVASIVHARPRLSSTAPSSSQEVDADLEFDRIASEVPAFAADLFKQVMIPLGIGLVILVVFEAAIIAALVTILVFLYMAARRGGFIDRHRERVESWLAPLRWAL